jgi:tripartite-type tricarboxylate transporter receptor subunit TctC
MSVQVKPWRRLAKQAVAASITASAVLAAAPAWASWPEKPVRMILGFSPGGATDIVARVFAAGLSKLWGQAVIVENQAGAGGVIATEAAARAAPDGYTLFMGTTGNLSINQHLYSMRIDPLKALVPVSKAVDVEFILVANPALPARNVKELIALAKKRPGEINYSSSGTGGVPHLAGALFNDMTGVKLAHIPYKGSGPSFTDLLGGQISLTFDNLVQALPYVQAGKLRPLAVLATKRSSLLPDVPTMAEAGVGGYDVTNWIGVVAPAGTSEDIIEKINADMGKVQADPVVRERLQKMGAPVAITTPQEFGASIKADSEKWAKIIKDANIQP